MLILRPTRYEPTIAEWSHLCFDPPIQEVRRSWNNHKSLYKVDWMGYIYKFIKIFKKGRGWSGFERAGWQAQEFKNMIGKKKKNEKKKKNKKYI